MLLGKKKEQMAPKAFSLVASSPSVSLSDLSTGAFSGRTEKYRSEDDSSAPVHIDCKGPSGGIVK